MVMFAARDFSAKRGASDEQISRASVRSEQRSLAEKELPPSGLRPIWPVAASLVDHRSTWDMLPPCALPQVELSATNVGHIYEFRPLRNPVEKAWSAVRRIHTPPKSEIDS